VGEIRCEQCGADDYRLLDETTGEVMCSFCRNRWIVPELAKKTETEKFLEQQAKQPRVIRDNTSDTDEQLMRMISGIAGGGLRRGFRAIATVLVIAVIVIVAVVVLKIIF